MFIDLGLKYSDLVCLFSWCQPRQWDGNIYSFPNIWQNTGTSGLNPGGSPKAQEGDTRAEEQ